MQGEALRTASSGSEPFAIMAKPVGPSCNLKCDYCYYLETERLYEKPHQFRMSDALLERFIRQYIAAGPGPAVLFTWHGGEPTLAGLDFFRLAVDLQRRYLPEGWTCWNNLQTNGLLLDDDWCSFLADQHFDVGVSLDGTQQLHDEHRKDYSGCGTYERAVSAVRRLQAHGVQPDLLCTVTSAIAEEPVAVYRTLRSLNTGWIQFIPIVRHTADGQVTQDSVTGEQYGHFLSTVFDEWVYNDLGRLEVQLFAEMYLVWSGQPANLCWMAPTCGRVPVLEHDGSLYACDHFVMPDHRIGHVEAPSLGELVGSPAQRRFGLDKQDRLHTRCRGCAWLALCNGGCPKERFAVSEDGEPGLNYLCRGLQQIFARAEQPMKHMIRRRKEGAASEAIMAELRAISRAQWQGVGRNDLCLCGSGRKAKHCCWSRRPC